MENKKRKRIMKGKLSEDLALDPVAEFMKKKQETCKHNSGIRSNTGSADSYCIDCGLPWYKCR